MYNKFFKRFFDIVLSSLALIILSPVLLVVGIIIKISTRGKVFFLQERLGKEGKVFKIIKFRTMVENAEHIGEGLRVSSEDDNRITKIGRFLRKTSLDELPQLINIVKGDMSLIGPRPPVIYHPHKYEDYPEFQKARFTIRPGITGLAQVRLRNNGTWDERIDVDLEYLENITFMGDVKIIFETIFKVLKCESVYGNVVKVSKVNKNAKILKNVKGRSVEKV